MRLPTDNDIMELDMKIRFFTVPNILTLCNLLCGIMAVVYTVMQFGNDDFRLALPLYFVLGSAVFDYLDGASARLLKQYSALGVQLDSLADMVSFGLVPSLLLAVMFDKAGDGDTWTTVVTFSVALCSALRLAKFNIDESQKSSFEGLATPPCALLVASLAYWFTRDFGGVPLSRGVLAAVSIVLSWLLISPVRMFSLKFAGFRFEGINVVRYIFLGVAAAVLLAGGLEMLWGVIIVYVLTSFVMWISCKKHD